MSELEEEQELLVVELEVVVELDVVVCDVVVDVVVVVVVVVVVLVAVEVDEESVENDVDDNVELCVCDVEETVLAVEEELGPALLMVPVTEFDMAAAEVEDVIDPTLGGGGKRVLGF